MKYSVVVNMDQENKTTLRNMDFTKTTHLFIKNKKNGIKKCDLIMSSLANLPYCGGERWGDLILSSQSNLKSIFFYQKSKIVTKDVIF